MTRFPLRRQQPLPLLTARWLVTAMRAWLTTRRRGWLALASWLAYWGWTSASFALGVPVSHGGWRLTLAFTLLALTAGMTGLWASRAMPAFLGRRRLRQRQARCSHYGAIAVETGGKVVGHLCLGCDKALPAGWKEPKPESFSYKKAPFSFFYAKPQGNCLSCDRPWWCIPPTECDACFAEKKSSRQPPRYVHYGEFTGTCPGCQQQLWCAPHCECDVCLRDRRPR